MQSEDTWMELHVLHRHGWTIAALAREFGLNWRTAKRYAAAGEPPRYRPRLRPAELSAAQLAHLERRLAVCPDLRATVLHRELVDGYGYGGSYTSLRRRVVELRPADEAEPEIRFETGPGIQTQGDWTDCGVWPLGDGATELYAWVAILGFSRMLAVRFATNKTRPTTLERIVRCVDDLGGASAEVLTDRDTALVVGRRADDRPIFAPEWIDVAALPGTRPKACRAYRAKTKGRIERAWGTFQDRLVSELRRAGAADLPAANAVLRAFLPRFNRRFAVPPASEVPAWRPVPAGLDLARVCAFRWRRAVGSDSCVRLEGMVLQLPPGPGGRSLAGRRVEVELRLDGRLLVLAEGRLLAAVPAPPEPRRLREVRALVPGGPVPEPDSRNVGYRPGPDHPWKRRLLGPREDRLTDSLRR